MRTSITEGRATPNGLEQSIPRHSITQAHPSISLKVEPRLPPLAIASNQPFQARPTNILDDWSIYEVHENSSPLLAKPYLELVVRRIIAFVHSAQPVRPTLFPTHFNYFKCNSQLSPIMSVTLRISEDYTAMSYAE